MESNTPTLDSPQTAVEGRTPSTLQSSEPHPNPSPDRLDKFSSLYRQLKDQIPLHDSYSVGEKRKELNEDPAEQLKQLKLIMSALLNETTARIVHRGTGPSTGVSEHEEVTVDWVRRYWGAEDAKSRSMVVGIAPNTELANGEETDDEYYRIFARSYDSAGEKLVEYVWMNVEEKTEGRDGAKRRIVKAGWKEHGLI